MPPNPSTSSRRTLRARRRWKSSRAPRRRRSAHPGARPARDVGKQAADARDFAGTGHSPDACPVREHDRTVVEHRERDRLDRIRPEARVPGQVGHHRPAAAVEVEALDRGPVHADGEEGSVRGERVARQRADPVDRLLAAVRPQPPEPRLRSGLGDRRVYTTLPSRSARTRPTPPSRWVVSPDHNSVNSRASGSRKRIRRARETGVTSAWR